MYEGRFRTLKRRWEVFIESLEKCSSMPFDDVFKYFYCFMNLCPMLCTEVRLDHDNRESNLPINVCKFSVTHGFILNYKMLPHPSSRPGIPVVDSIQGHVRHSVEIQNWTVYLLGEPQPCTT